MATSERQDPLRPFTKEMARTMTFEEVKAFWVARQRALRARSDEHYTRMVDPVTDEVLAEV